MSVWAPSTFFSLGGQEGDVGDTGRPQGECSYGKSMGRPAWFCHQWSPRPSPRVGRGGKGTLWKLALVHVARQATKGICACSSHCCTAVSQYTMRTIYIISFWFSFSGGSLLGLLSHLLRVNSSQYVEDSHSKMGTSDISNHLCLGAPCPWGSLLQ